MSEDAKMVECDRCGRVIKQSKVIIDKGVDYPELIKKAKEEGKDHIELCYECAGTEKVTEEEATGTDLEKEMSNVRSFI